MQLPSQMRHIELFRKSICFIHTAEGYIDHEGTQLSLKFADHRGIQQIVNGRACDVHAKNGLLAVVSSQ